MKKYIRTLDSRLAIKVGYIGQALIKPNYLGACIRIHLTGKMTPLIHIFYGGSKDALEPFMRERLGIPQRVADSYE